MLAAVALASALAQVGPLGGLRQPPATGLFGWLFAKQALFYRALGGSDPRRQDRRLGLWGLIGISFLYGIFHAAGPGHGKAVISSYLLANEETWRRGVALSFASALLQALTAIVIVAIAAVLIGATAKMMGDTVRVIEIASYALIVLIGARLLWVKGRAFVHTLRCGASRARRRGGDSIRHADHAQCAHHDHAHDDQTRHAHDHDIITRTTRPRSRPRRGGERAALGPCAWSGAGGIGRTGRLAARALGDRRRRPAALLGRDHRSRLRAGPRLVLGRRRLDLRDGLGTAITVAAIATLAVGAKAVAKRSAATRAGYGALVLRGFEVGAALMVMLFGVLCSPARSPASAWDVLDLGRAGWPTGPARSGRRR